MQTIDTKERMFYSVILADITELEVYMVALSPSQRSLAKAVAEQGLSFTEQQDAALPTALIRHLWFDGDPTDVVAAMATYQNPDGGFGNRLEPDIHAPESNPFAARLAMQVMLSIPAEATIGLRAQLGNWLGANQHADGDWHFSEATRSGFMQPWFAAWQHPSLNPACCVLGLAAANGIASSRMKSVVSTLWNEKASLEQARVGSFYELLPYVEYTLGAQVSEEYLDAIASNITNIGDDFEDAGHFFDLAMGGSEQITDRIPESLITRWVDRLLQEPSDDGGWPSPYNDNWRGWSTATNLVTLARLRG